MIVQQEAAYPPSMSDAFRNFLTGLLCKRPEHRLSWPHLLHHPFLSGVAAPTCQLRLPPHAVQVRWQRQRGVGAPAARQRTQRMHATHARHAWTPRMDATHARHACTPAEAMVRGWRELDPEARSVIMESPGCGARSEASGGARIAPAVHTTGASSPIAAQGHPQRGNMLRVFKASCARRGGF